MGSLLPNSVRNSFSVFNLPLVLPLFLLWLHRQQIHIFHHLIYVNKKCVPSSSTFGSDVGHKINWKSIAKYSPEPIFCTFNVCQHILSHSLWTHWLVHFASACCLIQLFDIFSQNSEFTHIRTCFDLLIIFIPRFFLWRIRSPNIFHWNSFGGTIEIGAMHNERWKRFLCSQKKKKKTFKSQISLFKCGNQQQQQQHTRMK